ncbi:hypothetical protein K505DRAFT_325373 [Melanomma pulvis-pyrius CBS 109.77]|uniref:GPI anchored cell wall protein n=1 Tax=Melanomma pulvis-pyrius CBS 109.77 TaxID=1314802 RepID=A0A6A6XCY5_9PLEO|nr:hypothetical protein K505DRAFT_325373 [Melanomma pulvis-pyrius CBS 109.77]
MFSKATIFLAFVAIAKLAVAAPPACLLGAINQYDDPADIKAVCQSKDAQAKIQKFCGDSTSDALSAFADVCNVAGVKVSTEITQSGSATITGSIKATGTGNASTLATATGTAVGTGAGAAGAGPTGSATTTGGAAQQTTGAAGKLEIGAAALFAGFGLLAAVL